MSSMMCRPVRHRDKWWWGWGRGGGAGRGGGGRARGCCQLPTQFENPQQVFVGAKPSPKQESGVHGARHVQSNTVPATCRERQGAAGGEGARGRVKGQGVWGGEGARPWPRRRLALGAGVPRAHTQPRPGVEVTCHAHINTCTVVQVTEWVGAVWARQRVREGEGAWQDRGHFLF